jgi:hypothetical protein
MTRMTSRTGWTRAAIVAAMAYAFVLQMLLLPVGAALHAATMTGAQGILCVQDGSTAPDHSPTKAHDGLCCLASCHGLSAAGAAPVSIVLERLAPVDIVASTPGGSSALSPSSNVLPLGSRAPPRLG